MQKAWDRQHRPGVNGSRRWQFCLRRGFVPWLSLTERNWFYEILRAQIKFYRPDVLLTHTIDIDAAFLREMKPYVRLLVGSHASPWREHGDFRTTTSCFPASTISSITFAGKAQRERTSSLSASSPACCHGSAGLERPIPVSFVGNVFSGHASRLRWLDHVCQRLSVQM